jgi:hypothetical protein
MLGVVTPLLLCVCGVVLNKGQGDYTLSLRQGVGRDSVVGIATRYELDGPGIESRWGRDFHLPSIPVLGPTQPPVQWVPGHSRG